MIWLCLPDESWLQSNQLQQLDSLFCTTLLKSEFLKFSAKVCAPVCINPNILHSTFWSFMKETLMTDNLRRTGTQVTSWPLKKICKTFSAIPVIHLVICKAESEQNWWITFPRSLLSRKVACWARFFFFFFKKYSSLENTT